MDKDTGNGKGGSYSENKRRPGSSKKRKTNISLDSVRDFIKTP